MSTRTGHSPSGFLRAVALPVLLLAALMVLPRPSYADGTLDAELERIEILMSEAKTAEALQAARDLRKRHPDQAAVIDPVIVALEKAVPRAAVIEPELSAGDRIQWRALTTRLTEWDATPEGPGKAAPGKALLADSLVFAQAHPEWSRGWFLVGYLALKLNAETEGRRAAAKLKEFGQAPSDERARAVIEAMTARAWFEPSAGKTSDSVASPTRLTSAELASLQGLLEVAQEAQAGSHTRSELMRKFLVDSGKAVQKDPDRLPLWQARALASLEISDFKAGWEAGRALKRLGAENSSDESVLNVLAQLRRRQWLGEEPPTDAGWGPGSAPGERRVLQIAPGVEMAFRWCPPGTFTMGSPEGEEGRRKSERQYNVRLTEGFWLGETEVTQRQWKEVMKTTLAQQRDKFDENRILYGEGDSIPMQFVSWHEASEFCSLLSSRIGARVTLPTNAEWEYACRAGTTTRFSCGNQESELMKHAWFWGSSDFEPRPVGQKLANPWGFFDLHGNVREWTGSWESDYPGALVTDYAGPPEGYFRVARGGSFMCKPKYCRSANIESFEPDNRSDNLGFRCSIPTVY